MQFSLLNFLLFLGTDATHAEHIETIKNRRYVGEQGDGSLVPGELGMGLVEGKLIILKDTVTTVLCDNIILDASASVLMYSRCYDRIETRLW